jgi:aspartate racemase
MPRHIGIVGCSAEGAALCYRTICAEGAAVLGVHAHPEVSMHTLPLAAYVRCLDRDDLEGVAGLMLESAHKLARAGADFLICPDNTIHQAFDRVQGRSPLPWLHIAEVVAAEAARRGLRTLGLTGTDWLLRSEVYPDKLGALGLACVRPATADGELVARIIMDELVRGRILPQSVAAFRGVVQRLRDRGCDAVILGCTELPLIMTEEDAPIPVLDSTRLLARAALAHALA